MLDTFHRELAAQRRSHGGWGALRFAAAAPADAVRAGLGERRYRRRATHQAGAGRAVHPGLSWLDMKLGLRMLVRYPGLSIAGGLGIIIVVLCGTLLVYARTATRQVEIALRSALGASRMRIVGWMFAEGLALSGAATIAGFLIVAPGATRLAHSTHGCDAGAVGLTSPAASSGTARCGACSGTDQPNVAALLD